MSETPHGLVPYLAHAANLARRLTPDRVLAEDLAQEGRVAAWLALASYNPAQGVPLDAFMRQRIRWAELKALKAACRGKGDLVELDLDLLETSGATPEDLAAGLEEARQQAAAADVQRAELLELLPTLATRDQAIVRARLEGIAFRRIAAEHGISFSRVKALAKRAFARLRGHDEAELEAELEERVEIRASLTIRRVREVRAHA